jgi:hypothetical protein
MAAVLRLNAIDREIEYAFEIKLLGLPPQASAFLAQIASTRDSASARRLKSADRPCAKFKASRNRHGGVVLPIDALARVADRALNFTSLRLSVMHLGRR